MQTEAELLEQALDGTLAQRDLSPAEARAFDAEVTVRIDAAVVGADFTEVAPVDHSASSADLRRRLAALDARGDGTRLT